ncbi:MAG: mannose-6-phosphate isomerase, class I [Desulfobacteraceae bacterium]|nr:mannose-6-phosphate isomerase, class I [Desulfobacteraceae bacterium]
MSTTRPVLLENPVQKYAWGSKTAIQKLLSTEPDDYSPWAELWMGAHPKSPSRVLINKEWIGLDEWIRKDPEGVLGKSIAEKYENTLPYLFKVLAADQPLSIQAHPDRTHAARGFDRENQQGIALDVSHRNYRDPWPKPEMICAIEPFCAMIGFRNPLEIKDQLGRICPNVLEPEIRALQDQPDENGIRNFFYSLMTLHETRRKKIISEALMRVKKIDSPEAGWIGHLSEFYPDDIGVLSPTFLNLVTIQPKEAVFLYPGVIHAYLHGLGIEIMANSDNVLRGGLTQKHIDPEELFRTVRFFPEPPYYIKPRPATRFENDYPAGAEEFALSEIKISPDCTWHSPAVHGAEILLCMQGEAKVSNKGENSISIKQGGSVLVPAGSGEYQITGNALFYRAGVPL